MIVLFYFFFSLLNKATLVFFIFVPSFRKIRSRSVLFDIHVAVVFPPVKSRKMPFVTSFWGVGSLYKHLLHTDCSKRLENRCCLYFLHKKEKEMWFYASFPQVNYDISMLRPRIVCIIYVLGTGRCSYCQYLQNVVKMLWNPGWSLLRLMSRTSGISFIGYSFFFFFGTVNMHFLVKSDEPHLVWTFIMAYRWVLNILHQELCMSWKEKKPPLCTAD